MTKSTVEYPADLRKKLKRSLLPDELKREIARRLNLLLRHYEINPASQDAGAELAHRLMMDHVPGFQVEGSRGAPRKTDTPEAKEARSWFIHKLDEARKKKPGLSTQTICKQLLKERDLPGYFRKRNGEPRTFHTLRRMIPLARQEQRQRWMDELIAAFLEGGKRENGKSGPDLS
jgi:hypothetical protein